MLAFWFRILAVALVLLPKGFAEEVCDAGAIDLVFVIDDSGSVGDKNFDLALGAAIDFTKALDIGNGIQKSRVGLVVFDSTARLGFRLDDHYTNEDVAKAINETEYLGLNTNISAGMHLALTEVLDYNQDHTGARPVPRIMLIMTDGKDQTNVAKEHDLAAAEGIVIYAIGVGTGVDVNELTKATGDKNNVFTIDNFSALKNIINRVCRQIASSLAPPVAAHTPASCGCEDESLMDGVNYWLDIIFIVDSSNGVSDNDFKGVKSFISSFGNLQIGPTTASPQQFSRVALINTADQADVLADLTTFTSGTDLQKTVQQKLVKKGGRSFNAQAGLQAAQTMIETEENAQRRLNVRKVVVLFSTLPIDCHTSKRSRTPVNRDMDVLCSLISVMEGEKTDLVTVGIKLAGATDYPYIDVADPCNTLNNTVDMMMDLLRALCRANCYCLSPYTQFTVKDTCDSYAECLYVQELSLSYPSAVETCKAEGGSIANVLSAEKDEFLKELHLNSSFYPYWIGLRRQSDNTYVWDDGQPDSSKDYGNWCTSKNQPNPSQGDCAYEQQCQGFTTGWFSSKCGAMLPTYFFSCQTSACSVNRYCDYVRN